MKSKAIKKKEAWIIKIHFEGTQDQAEEKEIKLMDLLQLHSDLTVIGCNLADLEPPIWTEPISADLVEGLERATDNQDKNLAILDDLVIREIMSQSGGVLQDIFSRLSPGDLQELVDRWGGGE